MTVVHGDECFCSCHRTGGVHIVACCRGQCWCGAFVRDAQAHEERTGHRFSESHPGSRLRDRLMEESE